MDKFCFQCQSPIVDVEVEYSVTVRGAHSHIVDAQSFCGFECLADFIEEMRSDTTDAQTIAEMRLEELGEEIPARKAT